MKAKNKKTYGLRNANLMLNKSHKKALIQFMETHPSGRLSKNLRTLLLDYLMVEGALEADYLPDLLFDLRGLFELMEILDAH